MSKLSFRARALDSSKKMPVFLAEELPDLSDYVTINRAVPQMPTGMEKEEEMELHLQQAITAQQASTVGADAPVAPVVIPTPKVTSDVYDYDRLYPNDYKLPKQLIRIQAALNLEPEFPDYDLDNEDEYWLSANSRLEISPLQFEKIMDTLEKQSEYQVINLDEAKLLLQEDDDVVQAVYDYWLSKRLSTSNCRRLIPRVRIDKRDGATATDPYVGFRRRAEKMQTRKNRKNDEESYEKILKLRHDLQKAVTLLEMVKRREKSKRELIKMSLDLALKRNELGDSNGEIYNQLKHEIKPSFQFSKEEVLGGKARRPNKKRKTRDDRDLVSREWLAENAELWHKPALFPSTSARQDHERVTITGLERDSIEESDGPYVFKRKRGCLYSAPVDQQNDSTRCWPWEEPKPRYRYVHGYLNSNVSLNSSGLRYVGLIRKRVGRGGRILFDRVSNPEDLPPSFPADDLPSTSSDTVVHRHPSLHQKEVYYRPPTLEETNKERCVGDSNSKFWPQKLDDSLISPDASASSLDLLKATDRPLATLFGPLGSVDVGIKVGVTSTSYSLHRDQLVQQVVANSQLIMNNCSSAFIDSSKANQYSSTIATHFFDKPTATTDIENGRTPSYACVGGGLEFLDSIDSQRAFEAIAAVMSAKQAQQLAECYQRNSSNNNNNHNNNNNSNNFGSGSNNFNLSNLNTNSNSSSSSSSSLSNNVVLTNGGDATSTNQQTAATQRYAIGSHSPQTPPHPASPSVERVLQTQATTVLVTTAANRCGKSPATPTSATKYPVGVGIGICDKYVAAGAASDSLNIRTKLQFMSS